MVREVRENELLVTGIKVIEYVSKLLTFYLHMNYFLIKYKIKTISIGFSYFDKYLLIGEHLIDTQIIKKKNPLISTLMTIFEMVVIINSN